MFAHEQQADSIEHAQQLSRTRFFWWVHYLADLRGWDYLWEPKPWELHQRHAWPSYWQKDAGVYLVPKDWNGTETHYHTDKTIPTRRGYEFWAVPSNILLDSVDFDWHPDPSDPPYIYHFPSQYQAASGVTYTAPGATEIKVIDDFKVTALPDLTNWHVPPNMRVFAAGWHPNPLDPPYIYHFPSQWQAACGVTYTVPGATEIKVVDDVQIKAKPDRTNWHVPDWIDDTSIDFSWHPNVLDPACNYHFDTKWHWNRVGGPEYRMPGATDIKYVDDMVVNTKSDTNNWYIPDWIDPESIDYTWVPCPSDPPYIYEFAVEWGWNNIGGPEYRVPGATERKYIDDFVAQTKPDPANFDVNYVIDDDSDVLRWRPNPADPAYIYVFGNQWYPSEVMPTVEYRVPGATERKYMHEPVARLTATTENWVTFCDSRFEFDYSWRPDPGSPPYIYVFGNQHYPAEVMPTVEYHVDGATERKYMDEPRARLLETSACWQSKTNIEFDFDYSWCPDPGDPAYIYVFGNQWHSAEVMPTVEYHVPGATERKFMEHPQARILPNVADWVIPEEVDYTKIDFSWIPDPGSPPYNYHFGTDYQSSVGLVYTMPNAIGVKFAGNIPTLVPEKKAVTVLDIFYMDRSNAMSKQRFAQLQEKYPHIQKIRYVNSVLDTIKRCAERAKTTKFWVIGSENDYADFDFAWHAAPWQNSMTHVFGSQWNKWSDTFLINKWEFERHARWAKSIEEFPNLNFVEDQTVHAPADAVDIYVVDHGNAPWDYLKEQYRVVRSARYFDNYLDTLRRLIDGVEAEHIWVVSSLCDYERFDFSWQPEAWQRDMLHVFPSNEQKFGDTFYVPVKRLREQIDSLELLDWFDTVNYCEDQKVERYPLPVIHYETDSVVDAVLVSNFSEPLALFTNRLVNERRAPTVSLWRAKTKTIVPLDRAGSAVIVPKSAIGSIQTQLYDYPHIDKTHTKLFTAFPLDIVFISNGENNAEMHWDYLNNLVKSKCFKNRIVRVDGVNGRVAAYQTAAQASETPWFFAVFAKLEVNLDFDFNWQPDYMQQPKHYIFHAHNPVNGLEYGHQAMIAYNKKLVLANTGQGLDFTLDDAHEVVPVVSGVARYNDSAWCAWRTAFREVLKLKASLPNVENEYRLNKWITRGRTTRNYILNEDWSYWGAQDAVEYYDEVNGDFDALKKSYEWAWLASYAFVRRNLTTDQ